MASDEERVEADFSSEHESIDERRDLLQLLIAEVQVCLGIWNKKSPAYKEAQKKKLIWEKIAMKLQIGGTYSFYYLFCAQLQSKEFVCSLNSRNN